MAAVIESKRLEISYFRGKAGEARVHSHSYQEVWEKTEFHCPLCGQQTVWGAISGDYYQGEQHLCTACTCEFHLPYEPREVGVDEQDAQRLAQLRAD